MSATVSPVLVQLGLVTMPPDPAAFLALDEQQAGVLRVDLRQQQGHILGGTEGRRVGADQRPGRGELRLQGLGQVGGQRREDQRVAQAGWLAGQDGQCPGGQAGMGSASTQRQASP